MMKRLLLGLGMVALLGGSALAAEPMGETTTQEGMASAPTGEMRVVRVNRGVFNLVGSHASVQRICGPQGAASVRTRSNGWDVAFGILTVGLYTPQHTHIQCNPPAGG